MRRNVAARGPGYQDAVRPGRHGPSGLWWRSVTPAWVSLPGGTADAVVANGGPVLADLAALTPPLLVCAAFLIAVWAFLRHELRGIKNPGDEDGADEPSTRRDSGESA